MATALVIIDMQNGFMCERTTHLVDKIYDYTVNNKFDYILATEYVNHEHTACYIFEGWKACMKGTAASQTVSKLASLPNQIFQKDKYSCWNDRFTTYLVKNNISQLYFVGVDTGCCVLHSAFDAYNDLWDIYVVEDLCGSTSGIDSHKAAIQVLKECITSERVIQSTEGIKDK